MAVLVNALFVNAIATLMVMFTAYRGKYFMQMEPQQGKGWMRAFEVLSFVHVFVYGFFLFVACNHLLLDALTTVHATMWGIFVLLSLVLTILGNYVYIPADHSMRGSLLLSAWLIVGAVVSVHVFVIYGWFAGVFGTPWIFWGFVVSMFLLLAMAIFEAISVHIGTSYFAKTPSGARVPPVQQRYQKK